MLKHRIYHLLGLVPVSLLAACVAADRGETLEGPARAPAGADEVSADSDAVSIVPTVVVVGGGAAGVGAAVSAARLGANVVLVERSDRLGNTTGVAAGDNYGTYGVFDELRLGMFDHYAATGQQTVSREGRNFEPDYELSLVNAKLAAYPNIHVYTGYALSNPGGVIKSGNRVTGVVVESPIGDRPTLTLTGDAFIDATDAGDLLGQAGAKGVDWTVGRESQAVYGEEFAGVVWTGSSPSCNHTPCRVAGSGEADGNTESDNFRVTLQFNGFTGYAVPPDYQENRTNYYLGLPPNDDSHYLDLKECLLHGATAAGRSCLPNAKMDLNADPPLGLLHPTSWANGYATGSASDRAKIETNIRNYLLGFIHFLRTERGMPWIGLSTDDYDTTGHFPPMLYVREGRRAIGLDVVTEHNGVLWEPEIGKDDSIAVNDYGFDSHCVTSAEYPPFGCEGSMWVGARAFQIPYGALVPRTVDGLLVARAASASHVGFGALRIEQQGSAMGQAAGAAAVVAARSGLALRDLLSPAHLTQLREVQYQLAAQGVRLKAFSDLDPFANEHQPVSPGLRDLSVLPAFRDLQDLAAKGAVTGYADGTVRPDAEATRAQASKIIALNLGLPLPDPCPQVFTDVLPTDWECPYVYALWHVGAITGYADGTFRPGNPMTRAQASKVTILAAGLPVSISPGAPHFSDGTDPSQYWYPFAETLWTYSVVRTPMFRPGDDITRGELATFAVQTARAAGHP